MTFTVLATDRVSKKGLLPLTDDDRFIVERIHESGSPAFSEALSRSDGLIVRSATRVGADLMEGAPLLKGIGRAGVGVDNIDLEAASARGIAVFNAPGGNTIAAAELTMALMLALVRRVPSADRSMRDGRWDRAAFKGVELRGRTLGLIGAGRIGGEVAKRCHAFGMEVLAYDPYLSRERAVQLEIELVEFDRVIRESDVVSLHVPLTQETRGLIDKKVLKRMRKKAFLVNASRGGIIDETALAKALEGKWIAGAALDVFEVEPLPADSPLRSAPNLVHTPHLGASTQEAQVGVAWEVATSLKNLLVDGDSGPAVNATELA